MKYPDSFFQDCKGNWDKEPFCKEGFCNHLATIVTDQETTNHIPHQQKASNLRVVFAAGGLRIVRT